MEGETLLPFIVKVTGTLIRGRTKMKKRDFRGIRGRSEYLEHGFVQRILQLTY